MREKTKDLEHGEHRYQIRRLTAQDGSWILAQFMLGHWHQSEAAFASCQKKLLLVVSQYKEVAGSAANVPVAVMNTDGRIAIPDLTDDVETVMVLTMASFAFNVGPFITENALSKHQEILSGLSLPGFRA